MSRTAIISVDGHVKASRAGYREYVEKKYLDDYDASVKAAEDEGLPDAGNLNPEYGFEAQWDSDRRLEALESQGVVAEVLFPNGQPFQVNRLEDFGRAGNPELATEGRHAYNRWLADFCAETPGGAPAKQSCPSTTPSRRSRTSTGPRITASAGS